ncbi:amidohydrolase family protein [Ancylobacter defluvii]|uniref:5-methylthioadenosine/S-adenosylhomocysteine deaminase n=1 Tax=Ancylobacter defluvii TaxID=1282440 RepID=A0A9W6K355_9HYPH|nr:amidohydrolase family protein [Ancylobacter defluvii]GLK86885.1 5-methylthioadenosine/S-adenosylhomocysteine deaminase [Ancylobacter defluvii]
MNPFLIQNCRILGDSGAGEPADLAVEAGRIAAIGPAGSLDPGHYGGNRLDGAGRLLAPGMINGHVHSHEHFQKGRFRNLPLELWMNFVRPPQPIPLTARQVYLRTLIGAIETLRSGATTLVDDLNLGAALDREHLAAVHQAYEDIGIRALVGLSMMDRPFFEALPFVQEEFEPDLLDELHAAPRASGEDLLALAEQLATERHPTRSRVGFVVSPSAPQRCSEAFLRRCRALADRHDLPLIIHVQETRLQVVTALREHGCTYVDYLDRIGLLRPKTTLIHCVWLTPRDIELIARSGATVQHNPWSNLRLGSGIAPLRALLDAGVNVSVATDGCASTDTANMLNSVGLATALHSLRGEEPEDWVGAEEAWRAATHGGAVALGRGDDLGTVKVGATADFVMYRLDGVGFTPANDLLRQLVHAERGQSIDTVVVDGSIVMHGGRLTRIDEPALLAEAREEFRSLAPFYDRAEAEVARMVPALRRIRARCACHPIDASTYSARLS